jgi:3-hydroxyacyl-CoA dehydrogenase/enoyl-CoA hydratase/3-hydroxybutyryl-CoA epimerase
MIGAAKAVEICDSLASHGERFAAPALLREIAESGDTFYGRFASTDQAAA